MKGRLARAGGSVEVGDTDPGKKRRPTGIADPAEERAFGLSSIRSVNPCRMKASFPEAPVTERIGPESLLLFGGELRGFELVHAGSSLLSG
jgi:hypothetical protein